MKKSFFIYVVFYVLTLPCLLARGEESLVTLQQLGQSAASTMSTVMTTVVPVLPNTILVKATKETPTNAELTLQVIGESLSSIFKQKTNTETFDTLRAFLNWLNATVSLSKADDTLLSKKPYFSAINLEQLFVLVDALGVYLMNNIAANSALINSTINDFKNALVSRAPVSGVVGQKKPSIAEQGIFVKNMLKLRFDRSFTFFPFKLATNARDVLSLVCNMLAEFCGSLSQTYVNNDGFYAYRNDKDIADFLAKNTASMASSIGTFMDELAKNASIDPSAGKFYSLTAYFDQGNFKILRVLLESLRMFCMKKACIPKKVVDDLFSKFYAKYPGVMVPTAENYTPIQ